MVKSKIIISVFIDLFKLPWLEESESEKKMKLFKIILIDTNTCSKMFINIYYDNFCRLAVFNYKRI